MREIYAKTTDNKIKGFLKITNQSISILNNGNFKVLMNYQDIREIQISYSIKEITKLFGIIKNNYYLVRFISEDYKIAEILVNVNDINLIENKILSLKIKRESLEIEQEKLKKQQIAEQKKLQEQQRIERAKRIIEEQKRKEDEKRILAEKNKPLEFDKKMINELSDQIKHLNCDLYNFQIKGFEISMRYSPKFFEGSFVYSFDVNAKRLICRYCGGYLETEYVKKKIPKEMINPSTKIYFQSSKNYDSILVDTVLWYSYAGLCGLEEDISRIEEECSIGLHKVLIYLNNLLKNTSFTIGNMGFINYKN